MMYRFCKMAFTLALRRLRALMHIMLGWYEVAASSAGGLSGSAAGTTNRLAD
jgi:hypothetical protein